MKLYAANCTHQNHTVSFRLVEGKPGRGFAVQHIAAGRQVQIAGDLNRPQVDYVVEQQRPYGWFAIDELQPNIYVPIVWSVDKSVSERVMRDVIETNSMLLKALGSRLRREAAIATSHGMRAISPQAAETLSLSVEEEKQGTMDHGGDQPLAEGFRMTRDLGLA